MDMLDIPKDILLPESMSYPRPNLAQIERPSVTIATLCYAVVLGSLLSTDPRKLRAVRVQWT